MTRTAMAMHPGTPPDTDDLAGYSSACAHPFWRDAGGFCRIALQGHPRCLITLHNLECRIDDPAAAHEWLVERAIIANRKSLKARRRKAKADRGTEPG
jgi:hypothetical protein